MFSTLKLVQEHPKKRRKINTRKACYYCRKSHTACDAVRPCPRCVQRGLTCQDDEPSPQQQLQQQQQQQQQQQLQQNQGNIILNAEDTSGDSFLVSPFPQQEIIDNLPAIQNTTTGSNTTVENNIQPLNVASVAAQQSYNNQAPVPAQAAPLLAETTRSLQSSIGVVQPLPPSQSLLPPPFHHQQLFQQQGNMPQQSLDANQNLLHRISNLEQMLLYRNDVLNRNFPREFLVHQINNNDSHLSMVSPVVVGSASSSTAVFHHREEEPKWKLLMEVTSTMIVVRDTRTYTVIARNKKMEQFLQSKGSNIVSPIINGALDKVALRNPMIFFMLESALATRNLKIVEVKVYSEKLDVLVKVALHIGEEDFFWLEMQEIPSRIIDDAFMMDDYEHIATKYLHLPNDPAAAAAAFANFVASRDYLMAKTYMERHHITSELASIAASDFRSLLQQDNVYFK